MRTPDSADERQREPRGPSSDAGPPAPGTKTLLVTPHHFQHHRLNLAQLPLQPLRRLATLGLRYSGSCPDRLTRAFVRKLQATFAFQPLEKPRHSRAFNFPVGLFQSSNSHTVRASSIRLRPPQLSTNSWIKLSSDELNRLPLKFAPLVPISLLATTTVANAGTNVQQKVTPLRVHNQSKFRYPLTNLTTSDRWTVRSLRKWAILAVPKEPHPFDFQAESGLPDRRLIWMGIGFCERGILISTVRPDAGMRCGGRSHHRSNAVVGHRHPLQ